MSERLQSLDFFRGITIAAMILVNDPGDYEASYWPLRHANWNGWTPTDLVFPFFLFIVGVAMVFSFTSRLERGHTRWQLMQHVLRRGAILFALGIFVNGFPNHFNPHSLRVEGVLQRIALCYVISSFLYLWMGTRGRMATIFTCLIGYWILMRYVHVPGFGVPTRDIPLLDPDRNLAAWLDRKLLAGHLYEGTRDPEGLLSTIPAIATTLFGVLTGEWLRSKRSPRWKALWMLISGVIGILAGEIFNIWFPINKKLWTSSYVLLTAGLALIFLAFCHWLLDVRKARGSWTTPAIAFGTNAVAAYVFAEALAAGLTTWTIHLAEGGTASIQEIIYDTVFSSSNSPPSGFASLLYSAFFVLICWIPIWLLYRKQIFLKV
jgi:predicted acyltransferase